MAVTTTGFLAQFGEFEEAVELKPELITRALTRAAAYCSARVWGDRYEDGVYTKAAHLLAMGALGENLRIDAKQATAYGVTFNELVQALPIRIVVTGGFGGIDPSGCP